MALPGVTVVIPVHNRTQFLASAIASVRAQDYCGPVAVIVVDDGSERPVADLVRTVDPHVTVIRKPNGGTASARRAGCEAATTPLIAFLDDDDLWRPHFLTNQVGCLEVLPQVGMVWSDVVFRYPDREPGSTGWYHRYPTLGAEYGRMASGRANCWVYPPETLIGQALLHEPSYPSATVVRREFLQSIGGCNPEAPEIVESFDLFYRATSAGWLAYNDQILVEIRRGHDQSTADIPMAQVRQSRAMCAWAREHCRERRDMSPLLARRFLSVARRYRRQRRFGIMAEHVWYGAMMAIRAPLALIQTHLGARPLSGGHPRVRF